MLSATSVLLRPDSLDVTLCGGPSEASSGVLTGRVIVNTRSIGQLDSLIVTLRPQRQRLFQTQQSLTPPLCLQAFLVTDGQTQPHTIHSSIGDKDHEWFFSISVPGSTAETVYSRDHYVAYELVAEARVNGVLISAVQSKCYPISIKRTPSIDSAWTLLASEPVSESAVWRSKLELTLVANSRIVHDMQAMSVRGVIRPLAKGISMVRAGFQIIERTGRKVLVFGSEQAITQNEIIVDNCVDMPSSQHPHGSNRSNGDFSSNSNNIVDQSGLPLTQEISASRCLSVPEAYTAIQYDIHRGPIRINHELVMFVTILDDTNTLHNLRLSTPMFVLPKLVGKQLNLPRYEETGLDRLVETSGDCKLQRDVDFWSNYVLIDMEDSSSDESDSSTVNSDTRTQAETLADIELADSYAPDYCPLALDGYQQLTTGDAPPPSYPGAARTMERTVVSSDITVPSQVFVRNRRLRKLYTRTSTNNAQPSTNFITSGNTSSISNEFVLV